MKVKELHAAKNLEELNKIATVNTKSLTASPNNLLHSAEKILKDATLREDRDKDEEMAYIQYMKYLEIMQHVMKNPKLSATDKAYYNKLHMGKINSIFEKCQKLSDSLKNRYELNSLAEKAESQLTERSNKLEATVNSNNKKEEVKLKPGLNGVSQKLQVNQDLQNDNEAGNITPKGLKDLLEQKSTSLLIIDCRATSDFMSAHVSHPQCISIPSEMLLQGLSANKITLGLKINHPASYLDWCRRDKVDKIVLYDWNSSFEHMGTYLQVVYDAITKWDHGTSYKSEPYVIQGGMRNIYYSYPTIVNKPQNVQSSGPSKLESLVTATATVAINSISYPSFDEEEPKPKLNNQHSPGVHSNNVPKPLLNGDSRPPAAAVTFDRSTKPIVKGPPPLVNGHTSTTPEQNGHQDSPFSSEESLPSTNHVNINNNNTAPEVKTSSATSKVEISLGVNGHPSGTLTNGAVSLDKVLPKENGINGININSESDHEYSNGEVVHEDSTIKVIKNDINPAITLPVRPTIPDPKTKPIRTRTNTSPGAENGSSSGGSPSITITKLKDDYDSPRSSVLKRSHSNPNISQLSTESFEDDSVSALRPDFNRTLKPLNRTLAGDYVRRRDFDVVSSTAKTETGLKNLGNTCYMNSIMQCINHTMSLVKYFLSQTYRKELNKERGPSKGEVTEEVARAIIEMNKGHRSIGLHDLKTAFGKFNKTFRSSEQQDSHEFLTFLLDHMHEELNKARKQPFKEQKNDGLADADAADRTWKDYLSSNDSIITELFCGQQKSSVKCMSCGKSSTTFDTFFVLSIPIPDSRIPGKSYSLQECLDLYTAEEDISDWGCANCKANGRAKKKIDLWRLPPTLIIHFQRFYVDSYCKKRITEIDFPVDYLDLTRLVQDPRQLTPSSTWRYQLFGTSNHYGTMDSGHYTAYCRKNKSWAKFDDQEVCAMMSSNVPSAAAYIVFFSQIQ